MQPPRSQPTPASGTNPAHALSGPQLERLPWPGGRAGAGMVAGAGHIALDAGLCVAAEDSPG